ncbi:MAG: FecR domain-containing protein [Akkermansiaceae bacterium]
MKTILLTTAAAVILPISVQAESLQSAKVTTRINDVRLYQPKKSARQAKLGDTIRGHSSVQTGRRSRAQLTFQDNTVTRLGANSTFSFRQGSRDINLNSGSILLQVPKNAGGATIRTATVTAAITGTTTLTEYNTGKWIKFITLEGTVSLYLNKKKNIFGKPKRVKVPAGKMVIMRPDGEFITKPVDVDLKRLLQTSLLAGNKIFAPLSPEARREIARAVASQDQLKRKGILVSSNKVNRHPGSHIAIHRDTTRNAQYQDPPVVAKPEMDGGVVSTPDPSPSEPPVYTPPPIQNPPITDPTTDLPPPYTTVPNTTGSFFGGTIDPGTQ